MINVFIKIELTIKYSIIKSIIVNRLAIVNIKNHKLYYVM